MYVHVRHCGGRGQIVQVTSRVIVSKFPYMASFINVLDFRVCLQLVVL